MNPKKTEDGKLIGGNAGMTPKEVYQTMMDTKSDWEKLDGRQGYHYVISFKPGEASEETAYQGRDIFTFQLANELIDFANKEYEKRFNKKVDFNVVKLDMTNSYEDEDYVLDDGVSHPCYTVGKKKIGKYDKRKNLLRIFEDDLPVYENNNGKICRDVCALADSLM